MHFLKFAMLIFLLAALNISQAAIYQSTRSFSSNDELLYSKWIKEVVSQDIFSHLSSPYYGIKTDCADAAFALRAIYAYENKLSFKFVINEDITITEQTTKFNHVSNNEIEKLKAFIEFMSENTGSEVLASDNTYSIDPAAIRPGDLYISRWTNATGQVTRHVYIIKDILPTGDLLLYSSTVPRAIRSFLPRKGMPLKIFKESPFGFKRFLTNKTPASQLEDYSNFQYEAVKLGEDHFFKMIKEALKSSEDTLELNIQRRIENICVALTIRLDVVEMALEAKKELTSKCFNTNQYSELSTPSRDKNIILDIERLRQAYKTILKDEMTVDLSEVTRPGLDYLINENNSQEGLNAIKQFCSIGVDISPSSRIIMNIKTFYERYNAGLVSSNPNDPRESRWGLEKSKNLCPGM